MVTITNEKEIVEEKTSEVKAPKFNLGSFLQEVKVEFLKISWPSREQVSREFFSVILLVAFLTSVIYLLDKLFGTIVGFFTGGMINS